MYKKILVCGGREYSDYKRVKEVLSEFEEQELLPVIIQGGARGADELAKSAAMQMSMQCAEIRALWDFYGKSAGYRRNIAMLQLEPDLVIAFPGGKGTKMLIDLAEKAGIQVRKVDW